MKLENIIKEDLLKLYYKDKKHYTNIISNNFPKLKKYIMDQYPFSENLSQALFHYLKPNKQRGICECGNYTKYQSFESGYKEYCSRQCAGKSLKRIEQIIKTKKSKNISIADNRTNKINRIVNDINITVYNFKVTNQLFVKFLNDNGFDFSNIKSRIIKHSEKLLKSIFYYYNSLNFSEIYKLIKNNIDPRKTKKCYICGNDFKPLLSNNRKSYCNKCINKHSNIIARFKKFPKIYKWCIDNNYTPIANRYKFALNSSKVTEVTCNKCGAIKNVSIELINKNVHCSCRSKSGTSNGELNVRKFVGNYVDKLFSGDRSIIKPLELDIYIPEYKLAIEYNGTYFHSEISGGKDKHYHLHKTEECAKQGIRLLHIFDNEWIDKQEIVKSMLLNRLNKTPNKIFARKCEIREVSPKDKNKFLDENHLQGSDKSSIKLGLYYNNELVSIMTFGRRKITAKTTFELIRFCNKLNTSVVGGASKLFKYFLNNYWDGSEITTYADRRYSNGNLYYNLGFEFSHTSSPNYFYTYDYFILEHRSKYMKHKLPKLLDEFDPNLSEWQNMQNNDYDRIWDCGNMVFKYNK